MAQLGLKEIDETRLRTWVSLTIPLVYRGELTILEVLLRLLQKINEIGEGEYEDLDYQKIIEELFKYTEFFRQVEQIVKDHLDKLQLGTGNILSKINMGNSWALSTYYDKDHVYNAYDLNGNLFPGITCTFTLMHFSSMIAYNYKLKVAKELIGTFDDGRLIFQFLNETKIPELQFVPFDRAPTVIPFGDSNFYICFTSPGNTTNTLNKNVIFALKTTGQTLNKLSSRFSGYGEIDVPCFKARHNFEETTHWNPELITYNLV